MEKTISILDEMADFTFTAKYARYLEDKKRRETWEEAVERVKGMHLEKYSHLLNPEAIEEINWAFDLVSKKRVSPSMRSMQFGGKAILVKNARIFNCGVRHIDSIRSFAECFWALLCGTGITFGFSERFLSRLPNLVDASDKTGSVVSYCVEDTIEGWADSVEALLSCYFKNTALSGRKMVFDYSKIRKKGTKLKIGGGKAPGYKGLKNCHENIKSLLDHIIEDLFQHRMKSINAYDVLMHCADAVLSGGIRRAACAAIFEESDEDMMNAKIYYNIDKLHRHSVDPETQVAEATFTFNNKKRRIEFNLNDPGQKFDYESLINDKKVSWFYVEPQRGRSNNSVILLRKNLTLEKIQSAIQRTKLFGEPGFVLSDSSSTLFNPCFEVGFIPVTDDGQCGMQFCNLSSINGALIDSLDKFKEASIAATIIGTLQAGYTDFPYLNSFAEKLTREESLLGVSITGFMDNPSILLDEKNQNACSELCKETNLKWAKILKINPAARITLVKPEGTNSIVLKAANGIHAHHAKPKYFRRIQMNKDENIFKFFKEHNPHACEESIWSANKTDEVITFPIKVSDNVFVKSQLSAIEHLEIIKKTQQNWVDNGTTKFNKKPLKHSVSCTVIVDDDDWDNVAKYMFENKQCFSAVSFLSRQGDKIYKQAPFESVVTKEDQQKFKQLFENWKHVDYTKLIENSDDTKLTQEASCAGGKCELV